MSSRLYREREQAQKQCNELECGSPYMNMPASYFAYRRSSSNNATQLLIRTRHIQ